MELSQGKAAGQEIQRQHSVGNYVLDFYCTTDRIAIELDGEGHFTEEGIKYDADRTSFLSSLNIRVIRLENVRVFEDVQAVLNEIKGMFDHPDSDLRPESVPPETGGKK